jgi:hypothetical protein
MAGFAPPDERVIQYRGASEKAQEAVEYWIARSSRATTAFFVAGAPDNNRLARNACSQ